ncbi:LuxR C-terminal-related transcriptional regulator [Nocardioides sp.]|uniref:response regulator transcription factor n=1 Tax=Nocardioides sp. TaxID=35761 RepID=UPI002625BA6E|nr:LuxR C-terminal-related transcriptional regulator [Nocardioides sp.]
MYTEDGPIREMLAIATSTDPLLDRANDFMRRLGRWVPFDAAWLALSDPGSSVYAVVGSAGLDRSVTDFLDRSNTARDLELAGLDRCGPPLSVADLPVPVGDLPTWADCLIPAGYREGLGVALFEPAGAHVGFLGLLYTSDELPSAVTRGRLARLAPLVARGVSPIRSLLASTRIVPGAEAGAVLLRDGTTCLLPGLHGDRVFRTGSPVVEIANESLRAGQVYRSFLWPARDTDGGSCGYVRVTVLAATEVPSLARAILLVSPHADCRGLTPRELEVLGLVVDGRSNHEIASLLTVTPRTVAAHVEHLMHKLSAPSRTSAAVRAEREGCYLPPSPRARTG